MWRDESLSVRLARVPKLMSRRRPSLRRVDATLPLRVMEWWAPVSNPLDRGLTTRALGGVAHTVATRSTSARELRG